MEGGCPALLFLGDNAMKGWGKKRMRGPELVEGQSVHHN